MKKVLLLVLLVIVFVVPGFSEEDDVRKLNWGMSYKKVKEIEGLGRDFYKTEELLGMKVEVVFNCGNRGLYSVVYSSKNVEFVERMAPLLIKRYGEPGTDLDYSFLMESKDILNEYPRAVVDIVVDKDFTELNQIGTSYANVDVKKIIKGGLADRQKWEYGNTVAMLLNDVPGGILSFRPKTEHYENKKKFEAFLEELKKRAKGKGDKKSKKKDDIF